MRSTRASAARRRSPSERGSAGSRGATQIVVVTHLAQIASWADTHYALRKREAGGATTIEVKTLGARQARLEEIARMLSGDANPVSLEHAATLVAGTRAS